jgi:hypothetical protein
MKKVQRSFAVEYKSGRRKLDSKPRSIWGNLDLKSVARDVGEMPVVPVVGQDDVDGRKPLVREITHVSPLTAKIPATPAVAMDAPEVRAAEENDATARFHAPSSVMRNSQSNQRKPIATKAAGDNTSAKKPASPATRSNGVIQKQSKVGGVDALASAYAPKRIPVKPSAKTAQSSIRVASETAIQLTALAQLEAENQKLRQLLTKKLRAENTYMKRRLQRD